MTVHLTPEQEQRVEAILHSGAYQTIEDVVEAALTAVEQRAAPGFEGTEEELEALLVAGLNSAEIPEDEFWTSVDRTTDAMLAEHKTRVHP
jgi:Arc/MetJ-type ribon-helix-helix transcriptional regulator